MAIVPCFGNKSLFALRRKFSSWIHAVINHACTFTGHRPEKLDAPEAKVKEWLEEQIQQAMADGYTDFITGMQRGVDLWAAEILLKLKKGGESCPDHRGCCI